MVIYRLAAQAKSTGLDRLVRRPPGLYAAFRRALANFDRIGPEERAALQAEKLAGVLQAALKSPYYAQRVRKGPAPPRLDEFPLLEKSDVRLHGEAMLTNRSRLRAEAETGGTSGQPLRTYRSMSSVAFEQATIDHVVEQFGIPLAEAKVAVLRGDSIKDPSDRSPPFWKAVSSDKLVLSAHHLCAETYPAYRSALAEFRPDILMAYPSALDHLVHLAWNAVRPPSIPVVVTSSEQLPTDLRAKTRDALGASLLDYYGQAERVAFAWSVEDGVYWLRGDYGFAEFEPEDGSQVHLRSTGLANLLQPLVRYGTGDLLVMGEDMSKDAMRRVALGCAPFRGIAGRASEFVLLADGRRIIGLNHIPRGVDGAISVQIVQEDLDRVKIAVVPGASYSEASIARLRRNVADKLPGSVAVEFVQLDAPIRLPSGKAPLYINRLGT